MRNSLIDMLLGEDPASLVLPRLKGSGTSAGSTGPANSPLSPLRLSSGPDDSKVKTPKRELLGPSRRIEDDKKYQAKLISPKSAKSIPVVPHIEDFKADLVLEESLLPKEKGLKFKVDSPKEESQQETSNESSQILMETDKEKLKLISNMAELLLNNRRVLRADYNIVDLNLKTEDSKDHYEGRSQPIVVSSATRVRADKVKSMLGLHYLYMQRCYDHGQNGQSPHALVDGVYNPLQTIRNRKLRAKYHENPKSLSIKTIPLASNMFSSRNNQRNKDPRKQWKMIWAVELHEVISDMKWQALHWNELVGPKGELWFPPTADSLNRLSVLSPKKLKSKRLHDKLFSSEDEISHQDSGRKSGGSGSSDLGLNISKSKINSQALLNPSDGDEVHNYHFSSSRLGRGKKKNRLSGKLRLRSKMKHMVEEVSSEDQSHVEEDKLGYGSLLKDRIFKKIKRSDSDSLSDEHGFVLEHLQEEDDDGEYVGYDEDDDDDDDEINRDVALTKGNYNDVNEGVFKNERDGVEDEVEGNEIMIDPRDKTGHKNKDEDFGNPEDAAQVSRDSMEVGKSLELETNPKTLTNELTNLSSNKNENSLGSLVKHNSESSTADLDSDDQQLDPSSYNINDVAIKPIDAKDSDTSRSGELLDIKSPSPGNSAVDPLQNEEETSESLVVDDELVTIVPNYKYLNSLLSTRYFFVMNVLPEIFSSHYKQVNDLTSVDIPVTTELCVNINDEQLPSYESIYNGFVGEINTLIHLINDNYSVRIDNLLSASDRLIGEINTSLSLELRKHNERIDRLNSSMFGSTFSMEINDHKDKIMKMSDGNNKLLYFCLENLIVTLLRIVWIVVNLYKSVRFIFLFLWRIVTFFF